MDLTPEEKALARTLVADTRTLDLIAKVLIHPEEMINMDIVTAKTNEQLGEIVRANALANQKLISRWAILIRAGTPMSAKEAKDVAPD